MWPRLFWRGRLNALPKSIVDTRPLLLALQGYLGAYAENASAALLALERALRLFKSAGDKEGQAWASLFIGIVECRYGHQQRATSLFKSALALTKPGSGLSSWLLALLVGRLARMLPLRPPVRRLEVAV